MPQGILGDYNITLQVENGDVTFAYYVNDDTQNRLYLKYQTLFRWNETESGKDEVIHDNDFKNEQFIEWESEVWTDYILLDIY